MLTWTCCQGDIPLPLSEADQERVDNRMKPLSLQPTVEVNGIALWVGEGAGGGGGGGGN